IHNSLRTRPEDQSRRGSLTLVIELCPCQPIAARVYDPMPIARSRSIRRRLRCDWMAPIDISETAMTTKEMAAVTVPRAYKAGDVIFVVMPQISSGKVLLGPTVTQLRGNSS